MMAPALMMIQGQFLYTAINKERSPVAVWPRPDFTSLNQHALGEPSSANCV